MKMLIPTHLALCLFAGAAASCGGGDGPAPFSADDELCEHMQNGPNIVVTTSSAAQGGPDVSAPHTRYDLQLLASGGGGQGHVTFQADEATDFVFAFNQPVALTVFDPSGAPLTAETRLTQIDACADVRQKDTYELGVGEHTLQVVSAAQTEVGLVIEEAGAGHVHE